MDATKSNLVLPVVHLNGTSKNGLLQQYCDSMAALRKAIQSLPAPHGRDYYPKGEDVIQAAIAQREGWQIAIQNVLDQVEEIATHVSEQ